MGWLGWLRRKRVDAAPADAPQSSSSAGTEQPIPMLDTGGHMAKIQGVAFTPDGQQLVSASDDKTIRVWDVATGKTVRTIRGEAAPEHPGKIYAIALSPDGKWLAAGGWLANTPDYDHPEVIRIYDFLSGRLVVLLKGGHGKSVNALAYSPDGRHLISGQGGEDAFAIIWDVAASSALHWLRGHKDHIYAVSFTPDGQHAVTGSFDHDLRLWRVADGAEIARMVGHGDNVRSLAVAPDGTIASGDRSGEIRLWDGKTGSFRKVLVRQNREVGSLSFSPDGKMLLSSAGKGKGPHDNRVYDLASGRETITCRGYDNTVVATAISPDSRWAAIGGFNGEIHIWDLQTGERRKGADGQPSTLGGSGRPVWAVGFAADGRRIALGQTSDYQSHNERGPLEYTLMLPSGDASLTGLVTIGEGAFLRTVAERDGWSLEHRQGGNYGLYAVLDIKQGDRVLASIVRDPTNGNRHLAYSFTSDGETIISGGSWGVLSAYDRVGKKLGDFVGHEGDVFALAPSPDSRFLVSGAADQTLRLWNLKTRELLVTLFRGADGEWAMWTPQGYYAASPDGDTLIGWQINHGPGKEADYVRASQLARRLYRPDIVARAIELASANAALAEFGAPANIIDLLRISRPPVFNILLPPDGSNAAYNPASVVIRVAANNDPVDGFDLSVNGRQVATRDLRSLAGRDTAEFDKSFDVPLEKGENRIRIAVRNAIGETARELLLHFAGTAAPAKRGTLYVVAVGVDEYVNFPKDAWLKFARADALALRDTLEKHAASLHLNFKSLVVAKGSDREPTRANIEDALLLFRDATPDDTVALFLAGHGTNEGPSRLLSGTLPAGALRHTEDYLFLPQDTAVDGEHWKPSTVVRWTVFQNALQNARGLRLMFVDTCHAGGAYNPRLVKDAHDAEIIVFSATDASTKALEKAELGHGVFTFALTQGLAGAAANRDGAVKLFALQDYVAQQVESLTNGAQAPAIHLSGVKNFVIADKG
jgi:WD40 repeat protein/uncharacterized caspase-like protein